MKRSSSEAPSGPGVVSWLIFARWPQAVRLHRQTTRRARHGNPWPRGNCDRRRRNARRRRRRARADVSITISPIASDEISLSPWLSSSRTIFGDHLLDTLRLDRTFAQRDLHRAHQLVAIERHASAVALDHDQFAQLHALERGEAEIAGQANAAAADHGRDPRSAAESFTCVSRLAQLGQRMTPRHLSVLIDRKSSEQRLHLARAPRLRRSESSSTRFCESTSSTSDDQSRRPAGIRRCRSRGWCQRACRAGCPT